MKIGFYFNDKGFSNMDLRNPVEGNSGIGGTQYCFIMLADALVKYTNHDVIVYHFNDNILPDGVAERRISSYIDMLPQCEKDEIDIFIFKAEGVTDFVKALRTVPMDCIAWAHNYLWDSELNEFQNNPHIKRIVFVGHEEYDRYIDHPAIEKMTYIYNMFDGRFFSYRPIPPVPAVTYTGSLVNAKGFHILANIWPEILKVVPEAQLYVIGNGQIYNRNAKLGSLGIADEQYEKIFVNAITENGILLPSIHFCGAMGKEKLEIYQKTTVGVMNPSGKTETFGLSAVEMEACGIPVVTKAANGLFDTVINGETGYLVRTKNQLKKRIVELLQDKQKNAFYGQQGKSFADEAFLPEILVKQWEKLFLDIKNGQPADYIKPENHWQNNQKWMRVFNKKIHDLKIPTPTLIEIECTIRKLIKR